MVAIVNQHPPIALSIENPLMCRIRTEKGAVLGMRAEQEVRTEDGT
jgi:hypothetical protein